MLTGVAQMEGALSFNTDIRPILSENCFHCHGQDANTREADLRLDNHEGATRDLGGYAALVPGSPEESELILRITSEFEDEQMPPPDSNRSLTQPQIETLRQWVAQGGEYDAHWAFTAPEKRAIQGSSNPIDLFIQEKLEAESLEFSPPAAPATWLRRVSFDLTGLPPSMEAIEVFEKSVQVEGESAYEKAVDRLLNSPRFGERQASVWMDAARYADTHGFNNDSTRTMWRWRDWVIDAFNKNMPYDQFITEQLAGDLLPNPTLEQRIATGFNRNHGINSEGGIIEEEYRVEYVADRVRTVGMVWMGLTTECARCHDHKYDPFTQEDYYRLFAFFNNVTEFGEDGRVANAVPMIPSPTTEQARKMKELEDALQSARSEREDFLSDLSFAFTQTEISRLKERIHNSPLPEPAWIVSDSDTSGSSPLETEQASKAAVGIRGSALVATADQGPGKIKPKANAFEEKTDAFSLTFWVKPDAGCPNEAPLISNARYHWEPTSSNFGAGWDVRIIDGEIQFSIAKRFPAYSATLRTRSANIRPEEWRHIAVTFTGKTESDNAYTPASRFQVYIDGEAARLDVVHDGLQDVPKEKDKPTLLGADLHPEENRFVGLLDEIQQFGQALDEKSVARIFERDALDYALSKLSKTAAAPPHDLNKREQQWLSIAVLDQSSNDQWKEINRSYHRARRELLELERNLPTTMVMQEKKGMRDTFVLNRGNYNSHGKKVEPGVPESWIAPWPEGAPRNRLGLAKWLTQPEQPLTARVVVNRFWQQLFGIGLVKTSEDFGVQSEYPSHPDLLDWLAVNFRESGWDVKRFFNQIALSRTYRQRSVIPKPLLSSDPENRLLARGPRFRLPAEAIRDQALALSGLLNPKIGGPSVHPYQPEGFYDNTVVGADYPSTKWIQSEGDNIYRRSLYTFWKRTVPHPLMTTFDAPIREVCTVSRPRTNTPLQALALMNGPTFLDASRALAEKILTEDNPSVDANLQRAFRLATSRKPTSAESNILLQAFDEMKSSFHENPAEAAKFIGRDESGVSTGISQVEFAAYAAIMNMILNLDETLTKG